MRWPFRRHRGSQVGNLSPVVSISPPGTKTARQVISAVLADLDDLLDEKYVRGLVDKILLGLDANGLSIVASSEVE